jgi:hypothetical protein
MSEKAESYIPGWESGYRTATIAESERIMKLIEKRICFDHKNGCYHSSCYALYELLEVIREQKENESLRTWTEGEQK